MARKTKAAPKAAASTAPKTGDANVDTTANANPPESNEPKAAKAVKTVRMTREDPVYPGGPTTADVHPDEVENFAAAGWAEA